MANIHHSINYIEFPMLQDKVAETKIFYSQVFGWAFTDWGAAYISFSGADVEGGFNALDDAQVTPCGVLVVLYASDLAATLTRVTDAGGVVVKPTYEFPGGKRFHFQDPNGNELAVWSES
ncbi:MAG: hypothetical protein KTR14_07935 [Vampirovibrio sp.]|nr:hypothetical protein [Vampirovibrio sp.]